MAVEWREKKIAYFPIPKVACTSLKHAFFRLNYGVEFQSDNPAVENVHTSYVGTVSFAESRPHLYEHWYRICVVRDPVHRFLSAYGSRVVDFDELGSGAPKEVVAAIDYFGIPRSPNIHDFIKNISLYCAASPNILHHFRPQSYYIGHDFDWYSRVFTLSELSELSDFLAQVDGRLVEIGKDQQSATKFSLEDLSMSEIMEVIDLYAGDYAILKRVFRPVAVASKAWNERQPKSSPSRLFADLPQISANCVRGEKLAPWLNFYCDGLKGETIKVKITQDITITSRKSIRAKRYFVSLEFLSTNYLSLGCSYDLTSKIVASGKMTVGFILRATGDKEQADIAYTDCSLQKGNNDVNIFMHVPKFSAFSYRELRLIAFVSGNTFRSVQFTGLKVSESRATEGSQDNSSLQLPRRERGALLLTSLGTTADIS